MLGGEGGLGHAGGQREGDLSDAGVHSAPQAGMDFQEQQERISSPAATSQFAGVRSVQTSRRLSGLGRR